MAEIQSFIEYFYPLGFNAESPITPSYLEFWEYIRKIVLYLHTNIAL